MSDDKRADSNLAPTATETSVKAVLALVPVVGGALAVVVDDHMDRRRLRLQETVEETVRQLGDDGAGFVKRLNEDEEFADLFFKALQSAAETHVEVKRKALAKLLAEGVGEAEGELDEIALTLGALEDLELIHLRTLQRIEIFAKDGRLKSLVAATPEPVLAALRRHGLIVEEDTYNGSALKGLSDFGARLLSYVLSAGPVPPE